MNTITCISYHQLQCEIEVGKNEVQDNKKEHHHSYYPYKSRSHYNEKHSLNGCYKHDKKK